MSYDDEYDEIDDEDSEPMEFIINDKGQLTKKPETVEITVEDFENLQKGLKLLKEKYPDISKECFSDKE